MSISWAWTRAILLGAIIGLAAWGVLTAGGLRARPLYCVGVALAVAVGVMLVRSVAAAGEPPPVRPDSEGSSTHPYADMYFVEFRLSWGSVERSRFEQRVRPLFVRLATERLWQRHGIDPDTEPDRARRIVGERLWALMTEPEQTGRSPDRRQVEELVAAIEAI